MPLEDIEKELYKQKGKSGDKKLKTNSLPAPETISRSKPDLTDWQGEDMAKYLSKSKTESKKLGGLGKFLFWTLVLIVALGAATLGVYLFQYKTSGDVLLRLKAPSKTLVGIPFDLEVNFENNSEKVLNDVRLSLSLPEHVISKINEAKRVVSEDAGNLPPNSNFQTKIPIVIFGGSEPVIRFPVIISYSPEALGPKVRFEKQESVDVVVKESALSLDLSLPQKVLNGENFDIKLEYRNISETKFSHLTIELDLPPFFNKKQASPAATEGLSKWVIDDLGKGESGTITVSGNVAAPEQSFFDVKARIKDDNNLIAEKTANISVSASPLSLSLDLMSQKNYVAGLSDNLRYTLNYKNNSEVGLNDVVLKARLKGVMFDFKTIRSKGGFSSTDNTITWNVSTNPELRLLGAGAEGQVELDVTTAQGYPIRRLSDKNFILRLEAEISSPTVPYYVAADRTLALANLETKIRGKTDIRAIAYFLDPFTETNNSGPIPPKINTPTTYTMHWAIVNYGTDVKNIEVRASLPAGVKMTDKVQSNNSILPVYNERTSEVSWSIPKIPATKGVLGKPIETIFQISTTPNIGQIGQPMPILNDTLLKAVDEFTGEEITASARSLTTVLENDPTIGQNGGIVRQ